MGKRSREKGAAFERELAARWRATLWPNARRNLSQSRGAAREGGDVLGVPFHVEAKHEARPAPIAALHQGLRDAAGGPVLVVTNARGQLSVTMTLELFESLMGKRPTTDPVE